jgi:hypothetical protein
VSLASKLQIKPERSVAVVNAPGDVDLGVGGAQPATADAVILFVRNKSELVNKRDPVVNAARDDRLAWVAYPKAGQLGTDLNRDVLRESLAADGIQPVRQIAIDDVWSALRFRPA